MMNKAVKNDIPKAGILIIDDDKAFCKMLSVKLKSSGYGTVSVQTIAEGLRTVTEGAFDVVYLDVNLPDGNGLDLLPRLRSIESSPEVIIITGAGKPDGAELAIKCGAWDYIQKGSTLNSMILPLIRALDYRKEKKKSSIPICLERSHIIGDSEAINVSLDRIAKAANSDTNVLITGETGVGKELFAQAIHKNSRRSENNFVVVDCASLPETLIESILFGHKKGAFTGAHENQSGLVKQADGGTLFLDEIGELPLSIQKSFLRVLEDHSFMPIGSSNHIISDFRLIAATNRNLEEMVRSDMFREDLLYRIRAFVIEIPPLRERKSDIINICFHYTRKICEQSGIDIKGFSPEFFEILMSYDWPGNVRELVHMIETAITAAQTEPILHTWHLPVALRAQIASDSMKHSGKTVSPETSVSGDFPPMREVLELTEKQYIQNLLRFTRGNRTVACRISGLSRTSLFIRMKHHNIT
ncbi:sigma-54 dependent transcriptional regulator [bacterium]|nr:sigma-54 dependent transcriptional regulator [bacterium]